MTLSPHSTERNTAGKETRSKSHVKANELLREHGRIAFSQDKRLHFLTRTVRSNSAPIFSLRNPLDNSYIAGD